jgi:hypothetical protein
MEDTGPVVHRAVTGPVLWPPAPEHTSDLLCCLSWLLQHHTFTRTDCSFIARQTTAAEGLQSKAASVEQGPQRLGL